MTTHAPAQGNSRSRQWKQESARFSHANGKITAKAVKAF